LSDPLNLYLNYFTDDLCVFVTLEDLFPRWTVVRESSKLWLTPKSLYCPLLCGDLIVEIGLDLGDRSEWIRVERDSALCELHNGDIGILYGWLNFGKKSCVFVSLI
jgi:hypothetical protein